MGPSLPAPRAGAGIELPFFAGINNTLTNNKIFDNDGLGIDLLEPGSCVEVEPGGGCPGVTVNDVGDGDSGPNNFQNFPVLAGNSRWNPAVLVVKGDLESAPDTEYLIEVFASSAADPSGHGEGEALAASFAVTTNGSGHVHFTEPRVVSGLPNTNGITYLTATATDPDGNTSEFSAALEVEREGKAFRPR